MLGYGAQVVAALSPGRKDQAEIVDMSGPSRRFLHYKALPPKPPTRELPSSFFVLPFTLNIPSRNHHQHPVSTTLAHTPTHTNTRSNKLQAAPTLQISSTSYEPLWCRLIPSYECLLVGLRPSSSNPPVQMTWPFGRGLLPSFETDLATWYGLDRLHNHGLGRMALLT